MDLWLPDVRIAQVSPRVIDKSGRFISPLSGNVRSVMRAGARWGFRADYQSLTANERARMAPFTINQGGAVNRVLFSPPDLIKRGSFPAIELLLNNNFKAGTASWTAGADYSISAADRILTCQRIANTIPTNLLSQTVANLALYQPYALRALTIPGRGSQSSIGPQVGNSLLSNPGDFGFRSQVYTPETTTQSFGLGDYVNVGQLAGDYFTVPYISLSRCLLVDNGVNLFINSDTPGGTGWVVAGSSVGLDPDIKAPDGTTTAFFMKETGATSLHNVSQVVTLAGPADITFSTFVFGANRSWSCLFLQEPNGSLATAFFNLAGGVVGSTNAGTNWSNVRSSIESYGNSWFRITITARVTSAAATITGYIGSATGDNVSNYLGTAGLASLLLWRGAMSVSTVPGRSVATAGALNAGQPQLGSALYVKGGPASALGSLLPGDWFEINQELKMVTAPFNVSAAGLGYLQFAPALRFSPADNDPIVVQKPLGRFIFSAVENGWTSTPGQFADMSLDMVEAL